MSCSSAIKNRSPRFGLLEYPVAAPERPPDMQYLNTKSMGFYYLWFAEMVIAEVSLENSPRILVVGHLRFTPRSNIPMWVDADVEYDIADGSKDQARIQEQRILHMILD